MNQIINSSAIQAIVRTDHHDPFQILGAHVAEFKGKKCVAVRAFLPDAEKVEVIDIANGMPFKMNRLDDAGFFEAVILDRTSVFAYRLKSFYDNGASAEFYDSYAFMPTLGETDQYLFNEGNHHELYEKLGAHIRYMDYYQDKLGGISFAVWAPNAKRVSVVGDFNCWDGRRHVMRSLGNSGIWEIFVPGLQAGQNYKFEVKTQQGIFSKRLTHLHFMLKFVRKPPARSMISAVTTGRITTDEVALAERLETRACLDFECHLGSFMRNLEEGNRFMTYRELAPLIADYAKARLYPCGAAADNRAPSTCRGVIR